MTDAQRMMAEAERTGATLRVKAWRGAADPHAALLGYVSAGPWALRPDVLEQFTAILNRHLNGGQADLAAVQALLAAKAAADPDMPADWAEADPDGLRIAQGVAVLPVSGLIAKHARLVNGVSQPRGTSIEALRGQFDRAMASDKVRAILLHIESPGGYLAGVPDFADDLREADKTKPILAIADDDACSGAYWLGSQAGVFLANQNADVGSIGVYMVLVDSSRAAENEGIRVIPVASGLHKATGLAGTPISEERLAPLRRNVQRSYEMFLSAVLAGRGDRGPDEAALRAVADGRFFLAAEARDLRLIDDVVPLAEALRRAARAGKQLTSVSARAATDPRKRSK
ncbi:MAG TPA: S49 family peptidase, partial [Phycisphaerae bacterium]|nr:S49 family peptidase [Phycisphaerae bacterium]